MWARIVSVLLGVWLIAAPWVLAYPLDAGVNSILTGIFLAHLASIRGTLRVIEDGGSDPDPRPPEEPPDTRAEAAGGAA